MISPKEGIIVTTTWALPGCKWKLKSWDNSGNCILETIKTKRIVHTTLNQLKNYEIYR
jgi:hypothetical protein